MAPQMKHTSDSVGEYFLRYGFPIVGNEKFIENIAEMLNRYWDRICTTFWKETSGGFQQKLSEQKFVGPWMANIVASLVAAKIVESLVAAMRVEDPNIDEDAMAEAVAEAEFKRLKRRMRFKSDDQLFTSLGVQFERAACHINRQH
ncbi:hypothetical protein ABW20_dc0109761 [Dactylellina cionopaga]|nr:hypothetical protein ABW20_dc0109761 [Dactylellina cionopaga]